MKEFVDFIEPVNKLAEESPGFVWRLTDDAGRSSSYITTDIFNASMAVNLSIWEDIPSLQQFLYHTVHSYFLRNKKKWFNLSGPSKVVLWWIPQGELPTLDLAKEKFHLLDQQGPNQQAFTLKEAYS